jgi:hypothetical protein
MEIGQPKRVITIEPIEDPVPRPAPQEPPVIDVPEEVPAEPEKVTP